MSNTSVFGVDLSKNVFHIVEVTKSGRVLSREKLSREAFIVRLHQLSVDCELYMEACSGAHYFCRLAEGLGIKARQIAPNLVKPYVGHQKNDYRDAVAICEASQRKGIRFVPNKSSAQQEIEGVHCIRQRLIGNHTALSNQVRGLLAEHGVVLSQGRKSLYSYYHELQSDERLSERFKEIVCELYEELFELDSRIEKSEQRLNSEAKTNGRVKRLTSVPGIGVLTASALEALCGDPHTFRNGRQFAAYLGLVPRQRSTGGKERL